MFAFKTTSGSAPLYLNSVLQTYVPLEALFALLFIPERHKITFTDFDMKCSLLTWSLIIFKNRLKAHLFHLYLNPLSQANSIIILCFKKRVPFRLAHYSFTNCLLKINNSSFSNVFVFYLFPFYLLYNLQKQKRPCLLYSFSIQCVFIYYILKKSLAMCTALS